MVCASCLIWKRPQLNFPANINGNPDELAQDSMSPQQSQFQIEDNRPSYAQEDATAGLKKAIQDKSPTQTLLSFVEKGADVNIRADGRPNFFFSSKQLNLCTSWS
jgi:hypothetical protein